MMKKLFVLGIVLTMVMGFAAVAGAYELFIGVTGSADGTGALLDVGDYQASGFNAGVPGNAAANYVTAAVNETGSTTAWSAAFDPTHAASTPWDIFVWGVGTDAGTTARINVILSDDGNLGFGGTVVKNNDWKLNIVGGTSFDCGTLALVADYPPSRSQGNIVIAQLVLGTAAAPTHLQLVEGGAVVPEPGSLVALFSGLVGLVGYGIRRRK
jgi:hypothetical protein